MGKRHELADCESCPLNSSENAFVPSNIPASPTIAMVGEAPGFQEGVYGKPFLGPSGKLLNSVLRSQGYRKSEVMYTNVVLCRPPGNATPTKDAVRCCRPRLISELREAGVRDIVALGGTAVNALVDDQRPITSLRVGPPKQPTGSLRGSAVERVVPTWHPAYCLRTADAFPTLVSDIAKLKDTNVEPWSPPDWTYIDDATNAIQFLNSLEGLTDKVVLDIEVGVEKDFSFSHPNEFDLLCVGLAYGKRRAVVLAYDVCHDKAVLDVLRDVLRRLKIIAHNGKFDLEGLYPHVGALELWFDTMLAHYALDERPGTHGLKVLAVEKLGAPKYDDEIKQYVPGKGDYSNIPRAILYKYNAYDVSCTWDLFELFEGALDRNNVRRVHDHLVEASNQLMFLELNGITVDREYSRRLETDYLEKLSALENALNDIVRTAPASGVEQINPRSPKQIKEFFETQGVRTVSTDVDTLEALQGRIDRRSPVGRFVAELLKYRYEHKRYSTYVKGIRTRTYRGRVYTTYLLHGTTSGRLASRNPNLQNIVRDKAIRQQFSVSNPANVLIQADYKQAEGRVMTWLAQDEYLRDIFCDPDRDIFNELSDGLYGPGNWDKEKRVRTKAFFYGIGYGRQPFSLAMEYGWEPREAERQYNQFLGLIPNIVKWQESVKAQVLSGKPLISPFGRRRRFPLITDANKKDVINEALSFLPQSTASDVCLRALIRLRPMLRGLGWIRLTIHDALVVECPERNRAEVTELLRSTMVEAGKDLQEYVPFAVDVSYGKHWGAL